jgi:glutathione S-transferase
MLTLYGHAASSNVRKVLWTCHELGLDRLHKDFNGATLLSTFPHYRAINPNGMVPAIDDGGFVLWESNAIIRYLATKHRRHDLLPEDPEKRAVIEQWMDWQASDFNNAWHTAFAGLVRKTVPSPSPAQIETSRQAWIVKMNVLEARLTDTGGHVAGSGFTLADIPIGIAVNRWFMTPIERPQLPQVEAYYDRLSDREGYRLYGRNGLP